MHDNVPVILLGHGSRRFPEFARGLDIVAAEVQAAVDPAVRVAAAFFEFLEPSLEHAVERLAAEGARRMVVLPYFLFDGREVRSIIPEELELLRERLSGVAIAQGPALGLDARLVDLTADRAREALAGLGYHRPFGGRLAGSESGAPLGVVVVNRGSRAGFDPGDRLRELARQVGERLGAVAVAPAHAEYARPTIGESVREVVAAGARRVAVVPYLHFPGKVLFDNVVPDLERAVRAHPGVRVVLARTLCVDRRLVAVCVDRIGEALGQLTAAGV